MEIVQYGQKPLLAYRMERLEDLTNNKRIRYKSRWTLVPPQ